MPCLKPSWVVLVVSALALTSQVHAAVENADDNGDPLKTPRRALAARQVELDAAQKELDGVADKLRIKFEASDEWKQAQADLKKAQSDKDAAAAPVLAKLHDTPQYKSALEAKERAAAEADKLRSSGATGAEMAAASKAAATANGALVKLDTEALAADPAAKAAATKVTESTQNLTELQKKFTDSIKLSPEFEKATKRVEEARERRDRANVAVAVMMKQQAAKAAKRKKH